MKTSVVLFREFNGGEVRQRSGNGYMCLNDLLHLGNKLRVLDNLPQRRIFDYFNLKETDGLIDTLKEKEGIEGNKWKIVGKGRTAGTWVHPIIALDFALWTHPKIRYHVYKWVLDGLVANRNESGDAFRLMNDALKEYYQPDPDDIFFYSRVANRIKEIIGVSDWEHATEAQLKQRTQVSNYVITACDIGTGLDAESLAIQASNKFAKHDFLT